ncbi:MAG: leucine-rich repeat domain-containing protein, partial [Gammaproteobacteria bacterium]|nr:leucine-rich repeat domain-containing protein [Gammaproteobacteria bacterium]
THIGLNSIAINAPFPLFINHNLGRPLQLVELDLGNTGILDIFGIEQYPSLQSLNLANNGLQDLWPIQALSQLRSLDLSGNQIVDLFPLNNFTGLTALNLSGNSGLYFSSQIFPILARNNNLTRIGLNSIAINSPVPVFINQMTSKPYVLIELDLGNTGILDIYGIEQYQTLRSLNLANNGLLDIWPIQTLSQLQSLDLSGNQITDLYPLNGFTGLTALNLSGNSGINFTTQLLPIIDRNNNLTHIGLNGIAINAPLPPFFNPNTGQPYQLVELDLGNTGILDISGIDQYTTLQNINLSNNNLANIIPLISMSHLLQLDLSGNYAIKCIDLNALTQSLSTTVIVSPSSCVIGSAPSLQINEPLDGAIYLQGQAIKLVGTAYDPEDGLISTNTQWASSISGFLGTGEILLTQLQPGTHTLTASITDSDGNTSTSSIQITVEANTTPEITGLWSQDIVPGETITVYVFGKNFTRDGSTEVYLNGVRQLMVLPMSSELLILRVLVDPALYGNVTVATPSGTAVSSDLFGTPISNLEIKSIFPGTIKVGVTTSVVVFGDGFTTDGTTEVYFNGHRQLIVAAISNELLIVQLTPDFSISGQVTVTIPGVGTTTSSDYLIVTP